MNFKAAREARSDILSGAHHRIAPADYVAGRGLLSKLGEFVSGFGRGPLVVRGGEGLSAVGQLVRPSFEQSGLPWVDAELVGYCTVAAVERIAAVAKRQTADVVVGIGGGKVVDAAKSAAHLAGLPCVTVPTSPATCAAVTGISVLYDEEGRWLRAEQLGRCPEAVLVDTDVLASAPVRLLVAGIIDARAKHHEVGLAAKRSRANDATILSALALCRELERLLDSRGAEAVDEARRGHPGESCRQVAEAIVLLPGLIAGLAGEASKLAAAHAVHNAMTRVPGCRHSLHGEIVGFGILVQMSLEGRSDEEIAAVARSFARLGAPAGLLRLGMDESSDVLEEAVVPHAMAARSLRSAFPNVTSVELRSAIIRADEIATLGFGD